MCHPMAGGLIDQLPGDLLHCWPMHDLDEAPSKEAFKMMIRRRLG